MTVLKANPEYIMQELQSRIKQLHNQQDMSDHKSFTGDDLNQFEKVLERIANDETTMEDVYTIEALMIRHL